MPDGVSDETALAADGTTTSSTATAHPDSQRSPRHVDRSCTVCHRRKVRCDKRLPCAACIRGKHECSYDDPAGAGRPKRRRPRQTIADVASRISNLERSIVKGSSPASTRTTQRTSRSREENQGDVTPLTIHTPDTRDSDAANEVLIQNGPTSQYVDESVLSRMIEADSGKCALYATPPGPARAHAEASAFSLMGILSHPSSFRSEPEYVISRTNGMKLWHAFVQNVDPIVKILHIPTTEVEIFTAINQPGSVGKDTLALLYAIYFAAATSLEPDDISKMLDMTQLAALGKFRTHFQKALADTDALENPTVTLLQGLAIYLHIVPSWNSSRASWILNGLALRMALTIGLHTDGDKLGLPPFEAEVRRRVWWHLYARDFRALEDHGINPALHLPVSSTRMPGNFDDSDLTPGMTELPTPRRDWTRMTFQLVNIEVANAFHQTLPSMCAAFEPGQRMARRDELFEQLRARLAPYFASCHTVVPMQKFSFQIGQAIVHKMDLITRQQVANLETPDDRDSFATEENLDAACVCLEKNIDAWHDELLRPHKWSQRVHPQYFLVLYVLWHLCIRPDSPQASRAWGVVDAMFRVEQQRLANASSGQNVKRVVLERMRAKAEAVRPSTVAAPVNNGANGTSNDANDAGFAQFSFGAGDLPPGQFYEDLNFDWSESLENMEMPNWNTLVNDLRGDQFSVPGMF